MVLLDFRGVKRLVEILGDFALKNETEGGVPMGNPLLTNYLGVSSLHNPRSNLTGNPIRGSTMRNGECRVSELFMAFACIQNGNCQCPARNLLIPRADHSRLHATCQEPLPIRKPRQGG